VGVSLRAVAVVSLSLWRRNASARHGAGPAALAVVTLLAAFTFVSMLTIGIFVLPVTGLLAYACALA
jgi:heme/copper-type cytochrome/quinol oxidase subunit 2